MNIVETLGEHVCSFLMQAWDDALATAAQTPVAVGGTPPTRRSHIVLEDGTIVGSITNTFVGEEGTFTGRLSVTLPITCGFAVVEHHLQHFAVEFRNWILTAAAELTSVQPQIRPAGNLADVARYRKHLVSRFV